MDINGNIIKGKRVTAFSWPEPRLSGKASEYLLIAEDLAWLSGDVSELSDENGIARFTNLRVIGSSENHLYIHFTCDALATEFWGV